MKSGESSTPPPKPTSRLILWIPWCIVALLLALLCWTAFKSSLFRLEATLADGHAMMIEEMRDAALAKTNATEVADYLRHANRFYSPSDADQMKSPNERLLKRVRVAVAREIIAHLRHLTGKDLGNDPTAWISEYAPPEK